MLQTREEHLYYQERTLNSLRSTPKERQVIYCPTAASSLHVTLHEKWRRRL